MSARPNSKTPLPRLLASALALGAFCWGVSFRVPAHAGAGNAALDPDESRRLQETATQLLRAEKWSEALEPTLKLHAAYPESHIYIGQLAEIYNHLGRYRDEAAMWEEFLLRSPQPIEGCPQIAEAYTRQGLEAQAISAYEKCLAFEPYNPDSILFLARARERAGEVDRAAELYQRGIAVSPAYPDLETGLARMRLRQGKAEEARTLAAQVLKQSPTNTDALLVMGLACQRLGLRKDARGYFERGVQLADTYTDFHIALANMAEQDSDRAAAIRHYEKVTEQDATNAEAARRLAVLRGARQ